jgi:4-diphosphocytidyl-2-C-methyl-D-erythritol kinase
MKKITLKSPAKVNLYLRIVGRRSDGYHQLDTVFHRVSLSDTLTLSKRPTNFSFFSNAQLPAREGNLLFKAYCELQKKFPKLKGVQAKLVKRIPIGAGLGGGSSNAAFFLLGVIKLYNLRISNLELMKIGVRIGADVPFFLLQKSQAHARGIGEKLKTQIVKQKLYFLLLTDPEPLSTIAVYRYYREQKARFSRESEKPIKPVNDLQSAAIALRPAIDKALKELARHDAESVLMSGSGPTVFAVSSSSEKIKKIRMALPKKLKNRLIYCHTI